MGLEKVENHGVASCQCQDISNHHLDRVNFVYGIEDRCVANTTRRPCRGALPPANSIKHSSSIDNSFYRDWNGVWNSGSWEPILDRSYDDGVGPLNPECTRKCETGYTHLGGKCLPESGGGGGVGPGG